MCFSQSPKLLESLLLCKAGTSQWELLHLAGQNLNLGVYGSCTGTEPLCPPPQNWQLGPFSWMKPQIGINSSYLHVSNLKHAEIQEAISSTHSLNPAPPQSLLSHGPKCCDKCYPKSSIFFLADVFKNRLFFLRQKKEGHSSRHQNCSAENMK